MKAALASVLTALVLVSAAWASNVTPAQLSALSKRVTKLERQQSQLEVSLSAANSYIASCLRGFKPYTTYDEEISFNDGSSLKFSTTQPPDAGDPPTFWLLEAQSSCAK